MQCLIACPGLATHTLAGICALRLPSAASSSGNLQKPAKPQPPRTTCTALPQPPVQAPLHLLHTAEAALDLAMPYGMPRTSHLHIGRALRTVVAERRLLHLKTQESSKTRNPHKTTCPARLQPPVRAPPRLLYVIEPAFELAVACGMLRAGHSHTGRALCTVVAGRRLLN